jgi:hypothetical protein
VWRSSFIPDLVARVFALIPIMAIWRWAEEHVFLTGHDAATPGPYRSRLTPWVRRLQDLAKHPYHRGRRIRKLVVMKSSQSGFTEGVLNCLRWFSQFAPRNFIYLIDTREEAGNISERLIKSLQRLGENAFTDDPKDATKLKIRLRHMTGWFFGSGAGGKFANKQATFLVADEVEEHEKLKDDTSTVDALESRSKTADNEFTVILSKPKLASGQIVKQFKEGNQEEYAIRCPFCQHQQWLTFHSKTVDVPYDEAWEPLPLGQTRKIVTGRFYFEDCRDITGAWDEDMLMTGVRYECPACKGLIPESMKAELADVGEWVPTAKGEPDVISQHMSDFLSPFPAVSWGRLVRKFLKTKSNRTAYQGFLNHNCGEPFEEKSVETTRNDILKLRGTYQRGTVPWEPFGGFLFLGADIGKNYAKWVVLCFKSNTDCAVVDWGEELSPGGIAEFMDYLTFKCPSDGKEYPIGRGFMDAKYRMEDAYRACLARPRQLWPTMGSGSMTSRQSIAFGSMGAGFPSWFGLISYNDRDAKTDLYEDRIAGNTAEGERRSRIWFPSDVLNDKDLIDEFCNEKLVEDPDAPTAKTFAWKRTGPNHWGDAAKVAITGFRYMMRHAGAPPKSEAAPPQPTEPAPE